MIERLCHGLCVTNPDFVTTDGWIRGFAQPEVFMRFRREHDEAPVSMKTGGDSLCFENSPLISKNRRNPLNQ